MFGTIRKHQTWLWAVIITLTIISFVIWFSPYQRMSGGPMRPGEHGSINGKKISEADYVAAWREVHLHRFFNSGGHWPEADKKSGFDPEREAYTWLLLVQKQDELGIHPSEDTLEKIARQLLRGFERPGASAAEVFVKGVLQPHGMNMDDFERFVQHYWGIQELITTVGLSGRLIPPDQAKAHYERENQELATEAVFFSASNYEASINVPPEALAQYYSNRVANYGIPERVQVSYVRFNLTNYLPQAQAQLTNIAEIVEANYQRMGTNAIPGAKGPEESKAKLREKIFQQVALSMAQSNAMQFANALFAINPNKPEAANLKSLAASNNLPVAVTAPLDRDSGPREFDGGPDFARIAFGLNADEPFSSPVTGADSVFVMALEQTLPHETPPLEQIKDKVLADYKRGQASRMVHQAAISFVQSVTNGLAQGKSFTNICADAKVRPVSLPPFSLSTRSLKEIDEIVPLSQLKQAAFSTPLGKPSTVIPTAEGAMVLFVKAKLPLDSAKEQVDLPAFVVQLRRTRQQEAFDEWLQREARIGLRDTPAGRPQPPAMGTKTASAK